MQLTANNVDRNNATSPAGCFYGETLHLSLGSQHAILLKFMFTMFLFEQETDKEREEILNGLSNHDFPIN